MEFHHKNGTRKAVKSGKAGRTIKGCTGSKENFSRRPPHTPPKPQREKSSE